MLPSSWDGGRSRAAAGGRAPPALARTWGPRGGHDEAYRRGRCHPARREEQGWKVWDEWGFLGPLATLICLNAIHRVCRDAHRCVQLRSRDVFAPAEESESE